MTQNLPDLRRSLNVGDRRFDYHSLAAAEAAGLGAVSRLPVSLKLLLENLLVHLDGDTVDTVAVRTVADWASERRNGAEVPFHPMRILMPDSSGVPLLADLAAMRDAVVARGHDPETVNPRIPLDLVVDHSVVVDAAGTPEAFRTNLDAEFQRNAERYAFLRWAQQAFHGLRVVPPGNGICHQLNLERLSRVVCTIGGDARPVVCSEALIGMDSHTPMVNCLSVMGWGVGGIEAASAMLGEPIGVRIPEVVGCRLSGSLRAGVTTTDLVLTVTERLRAHGVLGSFVEFFGPSLSTIALPERATLSNMAPEYGATMALFPMDEETLRYLTLTGRDSEHVALVEAYARAQGLWHVPAEPDPVFSSVVDIDLDRVEPSAAGPSRPQDRIPLGQVPASFPGSHSPASGDVSGRADGQDGEVMDGDVVIAAITSCTNTSNPSVMFAAGLLARKAVQRGLRPAWWVKTSLAPGSRVVSDYLEAAGLQSCLDQLGFNLVGYGCSTCMGSSGPLDPEVTRQIESRGLDVAAVLSGNRNFENRIHPLAKGNYLVSPPLVVAYALAGTIHLDLTRDPLGIDQRGEPVYLADLWPGDQEIRALVERYVSGSLYQSRNDRGYAGSEAWEALPMAGGACYPWRENSTFIRRPPYFDPDTRHDAGAVMLDARPLAMLGDNITTDQISPVGAIPRESVAGRYLIESGVPPGELGAYVARRVNHEVMIRGTFANPLLRNEMVPDSPGHVTRHMPDGVEMSIYDAAQRYADQGVPLVIVAGAGYGAGSSRDWAAKGTRLLGVRAVVAETFERIHRANLVGMGVLPLQFPEGVTRKTLELDGTERFIMRDLPEQPEPHSTASCTIVRMDGGTQSVDLLVRIDTRREAAWYRLAGVLPYALERLLAPSRSDGGES